MRNNGRLMGVWGSKRLPQADHGACDAITTGLLLLPRLRVMRLLLLSLCLILPAHTVASADRAIAYGPSRSFTAYRNGEAIGRHELTFARDGSQLTVTTRIKLAVKLLGFTAYRYEHTAYEIWENERLISLSARTDDNGRLYDVRAERTQSGLSVRANDRVEAVSSELLPTSHWNFKQVSQSALLNTQTGREARVRIRLVGREQVKTSSGTVQASRYNYQGDVEMDHWFDDVGRWVKTTFTASDGSRVDYVLND